MLGIISSLPLHFWPRRHAGRDAGAGTALRDLFGTQPDLRNPDCSPPNFTAIPKGVDVLMIAHPAVLNDTQLAAIDQFVLAGGRALVFVDPNSEMARAGANPYQPSATRLLPICPSSSRPGASATIRRRSWATARWRNAFRSVIRAIRGELSGLAASDGGEFRPKDPVTANLQTLNLASVGALHPLKGATTTFTPLVSSSGESSLLDAGSVRMNPRPQDLMALIQPTGEKFVIAARISGEAKTAFPATAKVKTGRINVIVMADSDIFDDRFWVRVQNVLGKKIAAPFADNGAFVVNAVENLMGSSDLICLRTRASGQRPFTVVRDIQAKAQAQFQQEAAGAAAAPDRHTAASARTRTGRQCTSGKRGAQRSTTGRDRALPPRADRHPDTAARRAAQSAQGHRCAGRPARLHQHRAGAAAGGDLRDRARGVPAAPARARHGVVRDG